MEARVEAQSQSYRLVQRMQEANIHHGQEVRVDLPNVRVVALAEPNMAQVRFCEMGPLRIRQLISAGDERPLQAEVLVEGLRVHASGGSDVLNALVSSNGVIRLVVDEQSTIREVVGQPPAHAAIAAWSL